MALLASPRRPREAGTASVRPQRDRPRAAGIDAAQALVARLADVPRPPGLTPREAELLPWLATDLSYAAIATQLGYGPHNACLHALRLLRKLGVATRPAAVARWLRPDVFASPH